MLVEDRRHLDPRQRTSLLTVQQAAWAWGHHVSSLLAPKSHRRDTMGSVKCLYSQWTSLQGRNWGSGESTAFIISSKQACSLSQRKTLPHFSRLLPANTILRNGPEKEQSRLSILGKLNKKCRVGEMLPGSQEESSQQQLLPSAPFHRWRSKWEAEELCSRTQLEELGSNTGRRLQTLS